MHWSRRYTERLAEAGIEPSVGNKGDSYDNALAETINGLYKAELIHKRGPWKNREFVELATLTEHSGAIISVYWGLSAIYRQQKLRHDIIGS